MRALALVLALAAGAASAQEPAPANAPVDIAKAVDCATLSQQYGDILTNTKDMAADLKKSSGEVAGAGRTACMGKSYDAGMQQIREAIGQVGKKPAV